MKADAVSIPSTAVEMSGNRCCGADNAMPGGFIMALMGVLLQQGSIENSTVECPGGLLFQQGEPVSNGLQAVTVAGLEGLYSQSPVSGVTLPECRTGTESIPVGGESISNLLMPWVEPSVTGPGPGAPESMTQPGQAALGVSILGTAAAGQEADGAAQVPAGGETGMNVQVQVDIGGSSSLKAGPAVLAPQNNAAQPDVTEVITAVQNDEVLPDATAPKGETTGFLLAKNNLPAGPGKIPGSAVGGAGENEYRTLSAVVEQPDNALPKMPSISVKKFAAEILPYVMNAVKNSGNEGNRVTVIRLKLEPENLGEIKIRLSYAKGELTAHFYTASGLVKDAVECSLPQLRETLSQYHINLGEAGAFVGQEQQNNNGNRFTGYNFGASAGNSGMNYPENLSGDTGDTISDYGNSKSALDLLI